MSKQDDGLFLMEVLIDKIHFSKSPCFTDRDFRTCVAIKCPNVEPMEICEDDSGHAVARGGGPFTKNFNSGKSCLFSLKQDEISKAMSSFTVAVQVYKSLPCGCLPTKIVLGNATIDMTKEFIQARQHFLESPGNVSYEALKDSFRIVGPDKQETGVIDMFLRISCFGKLIVTRFQGATGPPVLGGSRDAGPSFVDRSCFPGREFQTSDAPCVCGVGRSAAKAIAAGGQPCSAPCVAGGHGGGGKQLGICPPDEDQYNSMPCEDPEDPCYCCGPKAKRPEKMLCRNTHEYCQHIPKGVLLSLPLIQDLKGDQIMDIRSTNEMSNFLHEEDHSVDIFKIGSSVLSLEPVTVANEYPLPYPNGPLSPSESSQSKNQLPDSMYAITSKSHCGASATTIDFTSKSCSTLLDLYSLNLDQKGHFGTIETVYLMVKDINRYRTFGTQATAAINKCVQVYSNHRVGTYDSASMSTSSVSNISSPSKTPRSSLAKHIRYSDVYFLDNQEPSSVYNMGMGSKRKSSDATGPAHSDSGAQTKAGKGVSIDDKGRGSKQDMMATVSHIRIGPRESCPVHGGGACRGPKCVLSALGEPDDPEPVKVSTVSNPRRGVFELVVRKLTGAPLAKNELMLEWTPPNRHRNQGGQSTIAYPVVISRPPKCKSPCKTAPCVPHKCCIKSCKKPCKKPCKKSSGTSRRSSRRSICPSSPCKRLCMKCCGIPCGVPCTTPSPCPQPCAIPCTSSPCLRPCSVYKKPRRSRSQPKFKSHGKGASPCGKTCPVVSCRSGPCIKCCSKGPSTVFQTPPQKCCSFHCPPPKCVPVSFFKPKCWSNCTVCCK